MQTFIAQFIRHGGECGSARLTASNSIGALLELFITEGEMATVSVVRKPRAALLSAPRIGGAATAPRRANDDGEQP